MKELVTVLSNLFKVQVVGNESEKRIKLSVDSINKHQLEQIYLNTHKCKDVIFKRSGTKVTIIVKL